MAVSDPSATVAPLAIALAFRACVGIGLAGPGSGCTKRCALSQHIKKPGSAHRRPGKYSTNKKGAKSENLAPRNIRLGTDHGLFGFELPEVAATMPPMMAITARTATIPPPPPRRWLASLASALARTVLTLAMT